MREEIEPNAAVIRRGATLERDPAAAARAFYDAVWQPDAALVVFFCHPTYCLEKLAQALRKQFDGTPLIGCTTAGEITPEGYRSGSLTGFSVPAADFTVATRVLDNLTEFSINTGHRTARKMIADLGRSGLTPGGDNTFAFMLIDGCSLKEEMVTSAVHAGLDDITLFGGSAGDGESGGLSPHVYWEGRFRRDIAVVNLIHTTRPFEVFKIENYVPTDTRIVITEAAPGVRRVTEINGDPAAREYARIVGVEVGELNTRVFAGHPVCVTVGDRHFMRSIGWLSEEDHSLTFACAIDAGVVLRMARGVDLLDNLEQQFARIRSRIGRPECILTCDCLFRRFEITQNRIQDEVDRIFKEGNAVGFYTYGEQFHSMHMNQTLTGVAIGSRINR